jgi:hypothetical protein
VKRRILTRRSSAGAPRAAVPPQAAMRTKSARPTAGYFAGKKQAKETAAKKPATKSQRKSA